MSDLVKWSGYEIEDAEHDKQEIDLDSGFFWKPEVGQNRVRFLPGKPGKKPFRTVYQHYVEIPGQKQALTVVCPAKTDKLNKPCPVCDLARLLRSSGNPVDYERAGDFFPSRRVYSNIIDRKNPDAGPRVYAFGKTVHEPLISIRRDEDAGGDFTDPMKGFDIKIERTGTGKNDTKYLVKAVLKSTPLGDTAWIEMQNDLDQFARIESAEEIRRKLAGAGISFDVEGAQDVSPGAAKGRRASVNDEDDVE